MAGTAATVVTNNVMRGPVKLFLNVALPAAGATLTLHTDGTPDSTASPNAVYVGGTKEGCRMITEVDIGEEFMDELPGPSRTHIVRERARLEFTYLELLDFSKFDKVLINNLYTTAAGYKRLTGGGLLTITAFPVAAIAENPAVPGKFITFMLYAAYNRQGLDVLLSRSTRAEMSASFEGLAIPGRPAGDQVYQINAQI